MDNADLFQALAQAFDDGTACIVESETTDGEKVDVICIISNPNELTMSLSPVAIMPKGGAFSKLKMPKMG